MQLNHFVYLYRDQAGKPRYVGYGENSRRALSHLAQTHNLALETLLQNQNLKLEIAGPFDSRETAMAVEAALISALQPDANIAPGHANHRFRPIGVPLQFAERFAQEPLSRDDLRNRLKIYDSPRFLCVLIQNVDFDDGEGGIRRGYDPANPPSDPEIQERVQRWWPLGRKFEAWADNPQQSPAILLAVHGKPGAQFIIASVLTNRQNWHLRVTSPEDGSRLEVPILHTPDLDAGELRGRRIALEAGLKFNQGGLVLFP